MTTFIVGPTAGRRLRAKHYLAYAVTCLLLGSNWPAVRVLVRDVPPMQATGFGYVIACLLTFVLAGRSNTPLPNSVADYRRLAIIALCLLAIPSSTIAWAEQYISASLTSIIYAALPLAVTLIVSVAGKQRVPPTAVIAMLVGAIAILVLFYGGIPETSTGFAAAVAVAASVFVCAWGIVYASSAPSHLTSTRSIAIQFGIGALFALSLSGVLEHDRTANWNAASIGALLFIAVFCTAFMVVLYYWLLKQIAAFQIATIDLIVPVVAFLEGVIFLDETVTPIMVGAAIVVLASTAYLLRTTSATVSDVS